MENIDPRIIRLYDYFAQTVIGMACAGASSLLPEGWHMAPAMFTGMVIAMFLFALLANLLSFFAGGFELLMPGMQVAMLAGMAGPMLQGSFYEASAAGGMIGLLLQLLFHVYDKSLHGEVRPESRNE